MSATSSDLARALVLARELRRRRPWRPLPGPQTMAYESQADIIGFGGAAGGGKTDLVAGITLCEHKRALITRREKAQTEGIVQRLTEIAGTNDGYNSQKGVWRTTVGKCPLIEFGGLDNPGDERRWQGRPHDLKALDEVTEMREDQARFIMGWNRTSDPTVRTRVIMTFNPPTTAEGRWVIRFFAPWLDKTHPNPAKPGELRWFTTIGSNQDYEVPDSRPFVLAADGSFIYDFDPADYKPEDIIVPKSRTFIPARVTDNVYYMRSGYMSQLQALPEPLRSQMLYGDFQAGIEDDAMQVIPTKWVEAAVARWRRPDRLPAMDSVGVDVARGGRDKTDIARRHGMWFDTPLSYPGADTPDGPTVAGLVIAARRDQAPIHLDVIGVGSSPYDFLRDAGQQVIGVNVAEAATGTDRSGRLRFANLRSQLWWRMREALDPANNTGICLPSDEQLKADLCAPTWKLKGAAIQVESREDIVKRIGRSPDRGTAYILALIDTPRRSDIEAMGATQSRRSYDPFARRR
ncbi:terminase [Castellaniella sp.]|uniref:terminase n=1 Tax=Castellaniella sp. TaxID=1955812 RepID=UPI002AFE78EE|nr:terminase [Castellaniella sp.]